MKTMDVKHGELVKTVEHAADTVKRHREFDLRLNSLLEQYSCDIVSRYREILTQQDTNTKRNPIHFVAMNKYTKVDPVMQQLCLITNFWPGTQSNCREGGLQVLSRR